jgi:hypothetical protein
MNTELNKEDEYELDDLIQLLEEIKKNGIGYINYPKAILCLCKIIDKLDKFMEKCNKKEKILKK